MGRNGKKGRVLPPISIFAISYPLMDAFLNTYDYSIDDKNRLSIPVKIRKALAAMGDKEFIISREIDIYLKLYPYNIWKTAIADKVKKLPLGDGQANQLRRMLGTSTVEAPLDNQGRIAIPPDYTKHVGIEKTIRIVGCYDTLQLWDPAKHERDAGKQEPPSILEELDRIVLESERQKA